MGSWYHIKAICLEDTITWTQLEKQNVQVKRLIQPHQILKVAFLIFFFFAIVLHACVSDQIRSDKKMDYLLPPAGKTPKLLRLETSQVR